MLWLLLHPNLKNSSRLREMLWFEIRAENKRSRILGKKNIMKESGWYIGVSLGSLILFVRYFFRGRTVAPLSPGSMAPEEKLKLNRLLRWSNKIGYNDGIRWEENGSKVEYIFFCSEIIKITSSEEKKE